jgi:hypothetical protein
MVGRGVLTAPRNGACIGFVVRAEDSAPYLKGFAIT